MPDESSWSAVTARPRPPTYGQPAATATALGALLVGLGGVATAVVTFLGKRGENAITGYSSLTNDLQKERDALRLQLAEALAQRAADQAEIARLHSIMN